ncbi:hypothetical protein [Reichenbachiella sp.]|uniref:hypothetical protein n=1 Tax=Reichenbachiella sp. TaxID=2184521 RepID=UPI003B5B3023
MKGSTDITRTQRAIQKVYRQTPTLVGGMSVQFFKDRFARQGWQDRGFERWADRKKRERGSRRAIGTKTGRLKRSPRVFTKTRNRVFVGTDVPYAQRFNEGFTGTVTQQVRSHRVREHGRRVRGQEQTVSEHTRSAHSRTQQVDQVARPFIGESQFLNRRIQMNLEHQLRKELRFLKNI